MIVRRKISLVIILVVVVGVGLGFVYNNTRREKKQDGTLGPIGAQLITESNRSYVGKECVGVAIIIEKDEMQAAPIPEIKIPENQFFNEMELPMLPPSHVSVFSVDESTIPEIIMDNGSLALFVQDEETGWSCEAGDVVEIRSERYESEVSDQQTFMIGHIKDGICYEGGVFSDLSNVYQFQASEPGEYHFYIRSLTSDYLSFKEGSIQVIHK